LAVQEDKSKISFEIAWTKRTTSNTHLLPKNNFFQILLFCTESLVHPVLDSLGYSKINRERMKGLASYLSSWGDLMLGLVLGASENSCTVS
jgi:hypothetical protein